MFLEINFLFTNCKCAMEFSQETCKYFLYLEEKTHYYFKYEKVATLLHIVPFAMFNINFSKALVQKILLNSVNMLPKKSIRIKKTKNSTKCLILFCIWLFSFWIISVTYQSIFKPHTHRSEMRNFHIETLSLDWQSLESGPRTTFKQFKQFISMTHRT